MCGFSLRDDGGGGAVPDQTDSASGALAMATVIFKATEACNARCIYCDVVHKHQTVKTMPAELLEAFFFRINEYLAECPDQNMQVIWHGGEPLLLGPDFFEQALALQKRLCVKTASRIQHSMQSNLTLFSNKFANILRKLGISSIGTSYDPVCHVRGLGRKRDSDAYNRAFMEGIELLEREGFGWGVIYVVTKLSLDAPLDIFHFLANLCPQRSIMFNPVNLYKKNHKHIEITPSEFVEFLGRIFPVWWKYRERYPDVEPFSSLKRNLIDGDRTLYCSDSGGCANSHINLAPDGSLSQCGRSSDYGLLDYGSILGRSFLEVLHDPQREALLERNQVLSANECKECRFWSICHGGCPLDAWAGTGAFHHKTPWCAAKKGFIENYFEPIIFGDQNSSHSVNQVGASLPETPTNSEQNKKAGLAKDGKVERSGDLVWIDPIGGLGDTLMISGVLKRVIEANPDRRFNLVARTKYSPILKGHPAIAHVGHPPQGARLLRTNYWDHEKYSQPGQRAFQILALMFNLEPPVEESLYVPWEFENDTLLTGLVPWEKKNILICPCSDSPKKQMSIKKWESLVERIGNDGIRVVQAGKRADRYVRGAFSLLGLTTPRQLISILTRFDAVIASDNFVMHAAHLRSVPSVVLWGPTNHKVYGYQEQFHIQGEPACSFEAGCIGPGRGNLYDAECPHDGAHCMDFIDEGKIHEAVQEILAKQ
jgi:radical SAM protein with 4Fe4S-binding SPASM domain